MERERSRSPTPAPASAALTFPGGQLLDEIRPDDGSAALTFSGGHLLPESHGPGCGRTAIPSQAVLPFSGGPSVEDEICETSRQPSPASPSIVAKLRFLSRLLKLLQTQRVCLHCNIVGAVAIPLKIVSYELLRT